MLSIISTVGTTVFGGYGTPLSAAVREFEKSEPKGIEQIIDHKSFPGEAIYAQALADLKAKTGDFLRKASAEINAIEGFHARHNVAAGNHYHFLASHTATGLLAARVLRDFCVDRYQASAASVRLIQGLQVTNERKFRLEGLPFLIQAVYEILEDAKKLHLTGVLNPTGGFKAAIPYMTLVGMIRQVEVGMIHETSEALITLAGLPLALDLDSINEFASVLEATDRAQETGIQLSALAEGLKLARHEPIESHRLWSLFEQYDSDHYILSGLGSIALAELRTRIQQPSVWLSEQAARRFDSLDATQQRKFQSYFERLKEPGWIDAHRHDEYENAGNAVPIKPGNVDHRFFIYTEADNAILIAELAFHRPDGSYDREPKHRSDYDMHRLWDPKS